MLDQINAALVSRRDSKKQKNKKHKQTDTKLLNDSVHLHHQHHYKFQLTPTQYKPTLHKYSDKMTGLMQAKHWHAKTADLQYDLHEDDRFTNSHAP